MSTVTVTTNLQQQPPCFASLFHIINKLATLIARTRKDQSVQLSIFLSSINPSTARHKDNMGAKFSQEEKEKSTPEKSVAYVISKFSGLPPPKITNEHDLTDTVVQRVHSQIQFIVHSVKNDVDEIEKAYKTFCSFERMNKRTPPPIEDWVDDCDRTCKNGVPYSEQWGKHEMQIALFQKIKNEEELSQSEFALWREMQNEIDQLTSNEEVQAYTQRFVDALSDEMAFYKFFFVEYQPIKFIFTIETLCRRLNREVADTLFSEFLEEYKAQLPTVQLMLMDIRNVFSNPFFKFYAAYATEFGATHAAIQVGCYILDWNSGGIVFPRDMRSEKLIFRAAFKLPDDARSEDVLRKVSNVCVKFNTSVTYQNINVPPYKRNCHGFVSEVRNAINADPSWSEDGPVARFLDAAKKGEFKSPTELFIMDGSTRVEIANLKMLREFWNRIRSDQKRADFEEMKMVVKSIERSYRLQLRKAQLDHDLEKIQKICPDRNFAQIIETADGSQEVTGDLASAMSRFNATSGSGSGSASNSSASNVVHFSHRNAGTSSLSSADPN